MIQLFLQYTQKEGVEKLDGKSDTVEDDLRAIWGRFEVINLTQSVTENHN